jgi:hypothetical protein
MFGIFLNKQYLEVTQSGTSKTSKQTRTPSFWRGAGDVSGAACAKHESEIAIHSGGADAEFSGFDSVRSINPY